MKIYGEVEVQLHAFLTSALDGSEWLTSLPPYFISREYLLDVNWRGPPSRYRFCDEGKPFCLSRDSTPIFRSFSPVTLSLFWLSYSMLRNTDISDSFLMRYRGKAKSSLTEND
jgi:hypothetical protein